MTQRYSNSGLFLEPSCRHTLYNSKIGSHTVIEKWMPYVVDLVANFIHDLMILTHLFINKISNLDVHMLCASGRMYVYICMCVLILECNGDQNFPFPACSFQLSSLRKF